jgi:hypothetical protein
MSSKIFGISKSNSNTVGLNLHISSDMIQTCLLLITWHFWLMVAVIVILAIADNNIKHGLK